MFEPYQEAEMASLGCLEEARRMVAAGSDPEAAFIACRKRARDARKAPVRAADAAAAKASA